MNGTGPRGEGLMTGRGLGKCSGASGTSPKGRGMGPGRGRGMGRGFARNSQALANEDRS